MQDANFGGYKNGSRVEKRDFISCKIQSFQKSGKALAFYLNKLMAFYKILKSEICTAFWH